MGWGFVCDNNDNDNDNGNGNEDPKGDRNEEPSSELDPPIEEPPEVQPADFFKG